MKTPSLESVRNWFIATAIVFALGAGVLAANNLANQNHRLFLKIQTQRSQSIYDDCIAAQNRAGEFKAKLRAVRTKQNAQTIALIASLLPKPTNCHALVKAKVPTR